MNRIHFIMLLVMLCVLFSCCKFDEKPNTAETEPIYTPSVAWTLDTGAFRTWTDVTQDKENLYAMENDWFFNNGNEDQFSSLAKINLNTGEYVWKSETIPLYEETSPVVSGDFIYVLYNNGTMRCYDDSDGTILASIRFGETERESLDNACFTKRMLSYGKYIFWTNLVQDFSRPWGVMRFDTSLIDFSLEPDQEQLITPSLIWQNSEQGIIAEPVLSDKGIIYFITCNTSYQNNIGYSLLGALDCNATEIENNATLLWTRDINTSGLGRNCLRIVENKIFVIDDMIGCYNRENGKVVYECIQTMEDIKTEPSLASSSFITGIFYNDNKLYYTGQSYTGVGADIGKPEKYIKNIFCIDARNGKLLWADMPPGGGSLGTRPIVHNGKAYVITDCGLRVYNSKTGTLIGVDMSVDNHGDDPNAYWDGKIIYFTHDYTRRVAVLTAIYGD